jgi:hypothetical protein
MGTDDTIRDLAALARQPWGAWQEFVDHNREARAVLEESARRCDAGDLGLLEEPLSAPAHRAIGQLDHQLLMLANGFDPFTGRPLGDLDPTASEGR